MEDIDEIKEQYQAAQGDNPEQQEDPQAQIHSEYLAEYIDFFKPSAIEASAKATEELIELIKSHNILYDPQQQFVYSPDIRVVNYSINFEVVEVEVKIGYFTFKGISIVNINTLFPNQIANYEGRGSLGKVFMVTFENQKLALKTTFFYRNQFNKTVSKEMGLTIKMLIREYCLAKIASIVGAGPVVNSQMGFDILVYKDCVLYPMEYCQNANYSQALSLSKNKLKEQLLKLHLIKFIHMDIKEDNICFSQEKDQFVFIDFGFSKIIQEQPGKKSTTRFFGTATYCSDEMSNIIIKPEGGFVDLYYNDICCLQNALKADEENCKYNRGASEASHLQSKQHLSSFQKYEKTVIASYLKFLLYKLDIEKFKVLLKKHISNLEKMNLDQLLSFIQGMNFSSCAFSILRQISQSIRHSTYEKDHFSKNNSLSQEHLGFYKSVFALIQNLNCIQQNVQAKNLRNAEIERKMLKHTDVTRKLNWRVYLKKLIEAIQINSKNCSLQDKISISKTAKTIISTSYIPQISAVTSKISSLGAAKPLNELEEVSIVLFCFSLSDPFDSNKADLFHSMIYNVVLLKLFDLEQLFEIYQTLQHLPIKFCEKLRMLLKFKTTLTWKHFQVGLSFYDRICIIERLNIINESYEMEMSNLGAMTELELQFLSVVNLGYQYKQSKKILSRFKNFFSNLTEKKKYKSFLKDQKFSQQIRLWYIFNSLGFAEEFQKKDELQNIIFRQYNNPSFHFEYFHFGLILNFDFLGDEIRAIWIVNLFQQIFQGTKIIEDYYLIIIKLIFELQKSHFFGLENWLVKLEQNVKIERLSSNSFFGRQLCITLHTAIQDKQFQLLPENVQEFYLRNQTFLIKYDQRIHEKFVQKCLMQILEFILIKEFYIYHLHKDQKCQTLLNERFHLLYASLRQKILQFEGQAKDYGLIVLNLIASYILYRKHLFSDVIVLFESTTREIANLEHQSDLYLNLKIESMLFYFKLAISYHFRASAFNMVIYEVFHDVVKQNSCYFHLLNDGMLLCELFFFLIYKHPENVAPLINQLSKKVLIRNNEHIVKKYYAILDKISRVTCYVNRMIEVNQKYVYKNLEDVQVNPYNGIYMHLFMQSSLLWSEKYMLQICKSFNFLSEKMVKEIEKNYYKYILFFLLSKSVFGRKIVFLTNLIIKMDSKEAKISTVIKNRVPKQSLLRLKSAQSASKLAVIRQKLTNYYLSNNSSQSSNKYPFLC